MQLPENIQKTLSHIGIAALNPMQISGYEAIQQQSEVLLLAPTGSGKTLAFLLPILAQLSREEKNVQCLILTPSRELAIQIEQVWRKMATGFKVNVCYGGHDMAVEKQNLREAPALLIGTPGRIADHIHRQSVDLSATQCLVLDEFDKSLTLGFHDQMAYICEHLPPDLPKKVLVSATSDIQIPEFAQIKAPHTIDFTQNSTEESRLRYYTLLSPEKDKIDSLFHLLCHLGASSTIIFCNHREVVERISVLLAEKGIENAFFHGGMEQIDREKTLIQFRNGSTYFLIASDLAARGLDIFAVQNIIHYHLPTKSEDFVHRNGRTARMNAEGNVYILLHKDEKVPQYLPKETEQVQLTAKAPLPKPSAWATLYISGGKKDKLSKGDLLGFFSKVGKLPVADIGLIEILDFMSLVAVKKEALAKLFPLIDQQKIKGKKYKVMRVNSLSEISL